jgi:hypothetical protein
MPGTHFLRVIPVLLSVSGAAACTGLVAGPESSKVTPVPASRDSAFVRARRALTGESFTVDKADSSAGVLSATRWPSSTAQQGSAAACHVAVAFRIQGDDNRSEVQTTSRWIAPGSMSDKAPRVCETERSQVVERTDQVLVPPPPQ